MGPLITPFQCKQDKGLTVGCARRVMRNVRGLTIDLLGPEALHLGCCAAAGALESACICVIACMIAKGVFVGHRPVLIASMCSAQDDTLQFQEALCSSQRVEKACNRKLYLPCWLQQI